MQSLHIVGIHTRNNTRSRENKW